MKKWWRKYEKLWIFIINKKHVYIFIILDLRKSVKRLNSILEDSILGGGLIRPERLTGIAEMFKKDKSITTHGQE